jgi:hypothetical protein
VASPPNLPAALLHRAATDPEEPWLFRSAGWDWVWHPWGELARWMDGWREELSALPPGARAGFPYRPHPESVVLDLAIQAAGLVSVPGERRAGDFRVEIAGGAVETSPARPDPPLLEASRLAGGAVVTVGGEPVEWTAAELVAAGERLQNEIGDSQAREIVVLGGSLADPVERTMLSWATLAGAAVVLEPDPALRAATAAWVRPTVFHGTPEEIAALRARVRKKRSGRLPFRRLRTVLVAGPEAMAPGDEAFWRERGVKVARLFAAERRNRGI